MDIVSSATSVGISVVVTSSRRKYRCKIVASENRRDLYRATIEIQKFLVSRKFPCTKTAAEIACNANFCILFEEFCAAGKYRDSHDSEIMHRQAKALVELHDLVNEDHQFNALQRKVLPTDSIWVKPHSPIALMCDGDSLCLIDELYSLGLAAATYTATWESATRVMPSPGEAKLFVDTYQDFKGKRFTKDELELVSTYSAHLIGYWGRRLVALNPSEYLGSYYEAALRTTIGGRYF